MVPFTRPWLWAWIVLVMATPVTAADNSGTTERLKAQVSLACRAREMQRRRKDPLYPLWHEIPRLKRELMAGGWSLRDIGVTNEQLNKWIEDHRSTLREAVSKKRPTAYRWYELNWPQRCVRR